MEYAKIKNGKIEKIVSTCEKLPKGEWEILPPDFNCHIGMDARFVDWETGYVKPLERLAQEGLVEDNRGEYWQKSDGMPYSITEIGQSVPEGFTNKKPPESTFAYWDKKSKNWRVDKKAEAAAQQQEIRVQRKYEFETFDKYQTVLAGTLTKKQQNEFFAWKQAWLDAPKTKKPPNRPKWFKEF